MTGYKNIRGRLFFPNILWTSKEYLIDAFPQKKADSLLLLTKNRLPTPYQSIATDPPSGRTGVGEISKTLDLTISGGS